MPALATAAGVGAVDGAELRAVAMPALAATAGVDAVGVELVVANVVEGRVFATAGGLVRFGAQVRKEDGWFMEDWVAGNDSCGCDSLVGSGLDAPEGTG